jgi:PKD repeat protein
MKTKNFFQRLSQNSTTLLIVLAAVVVVWIVVLAMIIYGAVAYLQRSSVAQQPPPSTAIPTIPIVSVEPTAGQVGTPLTISGKGWAPGSSISIYLLAPGQTQTPGSAAAATIADAQGEFMTGVIIPPGSDWQTAGTATVIASLAGGDGPSAQTTFDLSSAQPTPTGTPTPTETLVPIPTLAPTPTPTPGPTVPTALVKVNSNIRSGPGTSYPVEGMLLAGQSAEITGVSADGAWWQLSSAGMPNGLGWVAASSVTAQDTQNVPEVVAPPLPTPTPPPAPAPAAQPPAAVISAPNQAGQGQSITFDGSGSTASAGHTIVTYAWNFGDGATASGVSVSHSYANAGSFVVSLTVTDDLGQTGTATLTVQITQQGPTANFDSPKHGNVGDTINFNGNESTAASGHSITDYDWDFGDGHSASGSEVDHIFNRTGDFDVRLRVTDDQGLTSEVKHHVQIGGPLTASISAPGQGQVGQSIAFRASSGSSNIVSFVWSFGDGSTASGQDVSHVYAGPGNFVVTLMVTDKSENTATATQSISIGGQALQPPTAVINAPGQATEGQAVTFDGSASTAGSGSITGYTWKFGDGGTGSGATVSHTFTKTGNHSVTLIVTNSSNLTAKATHVIQIGGTPKAPTAVISGPATGQVSKSLSFSGSGSSAGSGKIAKYSWSFGDGHSGSGDKVSHTYSKAGTYTITLTVTNSDNLTATTTHVVTIS